jgi:hypothetical protein
VVISVASTSIVKASGAPCWCQEALKCPGMRQAQLLQRPRLTRDLLELSRRLLLREFEGRPMGAKAARSLDFWRFLYAAKPLSEAHG